MKNKDRSFFVTIRDFLIVYLPKQRCASVHTIKSYRDTLNLFINFLENQKNMTLDNISFVQCTYKNITDFLDWIQSDRKCTSTTRNQRLFALRSFLKYAGVKYPEWVSLRYEIDKIPIQKKENKIIDIITEDALRTILDQPNPNNKIEMRNLCFMILMYDTAARDREMLDLTIGSLHLNQKHPAICITGKGGRNRMVPIMSKTVQHLKRYVSLFHSEGKKRNEDYLFYTVIHGERHQMSDDNVARFFAKYGALARKSSTDVPKKVHPHLFRHARAIHLYRSGMPLPLLSEFMGHADVQTTLIYAYADTDMKRKAIEKATNDNVIPQTKTDVPAWKNDEELIRKLYGLK